MHRHDTRLKTWQRRTFGTLALGGGFLGIVMILVQLISGTVPVVGVFISLPFLALYSWGVWAGIAILESHPDALQLNKWFWAIQIPVFTTRAVTYVFYAGGTIAVGFNATEHKPFLQALFGSQYQLRINAPTTSILGFNLLAIAASAYLWHLQKKQRLDHPST